MSYPRSDPRWSPDGTEIAYESFSLADPRIDDIKTIKSDGTGLVDLTNSPQVNDTQPSWASGS
jgi:Tol biopolymer transport system component